jgi:predicted metal-dependent enzyme (double-stranded beta helix superfamily)
MRNIIKTIAFTLLVSSINFVSAPVANAGCQDYPESTTPACVAENLAIAKLAQEAYEAAQVARRLQEEQTARDNAAKDAADRAATIAADNALAPDDCARSTNRYLQRCTDIETARAVAENEAKSAADRAATLAADNALAPDDCARSTNRFLQRCIDIAVEKARIENERRDAADRAATLAADNALAPDDCARSTNRGTQRCGEIAAEKARIENEAISSIRKIGELDVLQKLANDKYTANKCDQAANKSLQVCIDSKAGADAVKNEAKNLAKKIIETQSLLTKPLVDENGEIILTALLRSKTLNPKDIKAVLDTSSLSADDKKSLSAYAQTLYNLKSIRSASNFKIPLSKTLSEEFSSSTPKICLVVAGAVKTLKPGVCTINVTFSTESGFEVQTSKKIVVRK